MPPEDIPLSNEDFAELLALRADATEGDRQRAYRGAARSALMWPEEVADLVSEGRNPQELHGIGPRISGLLRSWLEEPPEVPEPPAARRGYVSYARALRIVEEHHDWRQAFRGDLQMHTTYSDGGETIEDMARTGRDHGHEYIAITDHSKGLKIARGMDEARLAAQRAEIAEVNERFQEVRVLSALEMNLNPRGKGDMDEGALVSLDFVIGSFHSSLRGLQDQTDRYVAAVSHPLVDVIGHPRGRVYNRREGLRADWEKVFQAAGEHNTALEINSYPDRQDLEVELLVAARDFDLRFSIGTDAHNSFEMQFFPIGLAAAISAGLAPERIANLHGGEALVGFFDHGRH
ncbi:MAG: PHP domain-containing protein [Actinomycetota bacterium]